ncbi:MAG TPA: DNA polymerase III subunit delta [Bacilli bacterium]|nr:DNA polymerase III subunit delta [Bacilli bacterium]
MNLYLISSSSYNETEEEIKKITKENTINFDLEENSLEDLIEEAEYVSLFADKKYIVVKNSYIFNSNSSKDIDISLLTNYMDHPNPNTTIIFTTFKALDERKKIVKLFKEKATVIIKKPLKEKDLIEIISQKFKANNKKISLKAIKQIIELCQSNYDLILPEIDKLLICYEDKSVIEDNEISNIVSNETLITNFKFSDAVIAKNMDKAFKVFDKLRENKEEPVMLIGLLASQYRLIYTIKYYLNKGYDKSRIVSELKIHPYRVDIAISNSYNFNEQELLDKLVSLGDLDFKIKSGKVNGYSGLEMFLLGL